MRLRFTFPIFPSQQISLKKNSIPSDRTLEKLSCKCFEFFVTPNFFHNSVGFLGVGGEVTNMGVDSLNGKQDVSPLRAPALLQSPGINWSWGFFGGGDSGFFLFLLPFFLT